VDGDNAGLTLTTSPAGAVNIVLGCRSGRLGTGCQTKCASPARTSDGNSLSLMATDHGGDIPIGWLDLPLAPIGGGLEKRDAPPAGAARPERGRAARQLGAQGAPARQRRRHRSAGRTSRIASSRRLRCRTDRSSHRCRRQRRLAVTHRQRRVGTSHRAGIRRRREEMDLPRRGFSAAYAPTGGGSSLPVCHRRNTGRWRLITSRMAKSTTLIFSEDAGTQHAVLAARRPADSDSTCG
jgi:hypothetical protein